MSSATSPTASAFARKTYSPWVMKLSALMNERQRTDPTFKQTAILVEQQVSRGKTNEFANEQTHAYELQSCYVLNGPADKARVDSDIAKAYAERRRTPQQSPLFA